MSVTAQDNRPNFEVRVNVAVELGRVSAMA